MGFTVNKTGSYQGEDPSKAVKTTYNSDGAADIWYDKDNPELDPNNANDHVSKYLKEQNDKRIKQNSKPKA